MAFGTARLSGRIRIPRAVTPALSGTITVRADPAASFGGTVLVSRALARACLAPERHVGCAVYLGLGGVWTRADTARGTVEWGRGRNTTEDWARFTLVDSRCARFHASSIAAGGVPVLIQMRLRTNEVDVTETVFSGETVPTSNADALRPAGTFTAKGLSSAWGKRGRRGTVRSGALAGHRRGDLVRSWAAAAGLETTGMVIPDGGEIAKRAELISLSGAELLARFRLVEGWQYRPAVSGAIEVLEAGYSDGPSRFDFGPETYAAFTELLPDNPATFYTLTGAQLERPTRRTATVNAGETMVSVTFEGAAEVFRTWRHGSGLSEKLHEVTTEYNRTADGLITGQMRSRKHVVTGWVNPETAVAVGVLCADGKYHPTPDWVWQVEGITDEALTWDGCELREKTTTIKRWYAPLGFRTHVPSDCLRVNGEYRYGASGSADELVEVAKEIATYGGGSENIIVFGWVVYGLETVVGATAPAEAYQLVNALGHTITGAVSPVSQMIGANGALLEAPAIASGSPAASPTEPVHQISPMQLTFEVCGTGYPYAETAITVEEAQSMEELQTAADVLTETLGPRYLVDHWGLLGLDVADPCTLTGMLARDGETHATERVRNLYLKPMLVDDVAYSYDFATGSFRQKTHLLCPWKRSRT